MLDAFKNWRYLWWLHLISWFGYIHVTLATYMLIDTHTLTQSFRYIDWGEYSFIHTLALVWHYLSVLCIGIVNILQSFHYIDWALCIGSKNTSLHNGHKSKARYLLSWTATSHKVSGTWQLPCVWQKHILPNKNVVCTLLQYLFHIQNIIN